MDQDERRLSRRQKKKSDWSWLDAALECSELVWYMLRFVFKGIGKLLSHLD